jgi:hypothetical protein
MRRTLCTTVVLALLIPWALASQELPTLPAVGYDWTYFDLPVEGQFGGVFAEDVNANSDVLGWAFGGNSQLSYLRQHGGFITPLACPDGNRVALTVGSINRWGEIAGSCPHETTRQPQGIVLTPSSPRRNPPTILTVPGASQTFASGINDLGHVVGIFYDDRGGPLPFIAAQGRAWEIANPLQPGVGTIAESVTNWGAIVGHYRASSPDHRTHGWLYFYTGQAYSFDVPGMHDTFVWDMNDYGQAVGATSDQQHTQSFFYETNGVFYAIQSPDPAVIFTDVSGLNSQGQLVGRVILPDPTDEMNLLSRGFLATPLPASLLGGGAQATAAGASQSRASNGGRPLQQGSRPLRLNTESCEETAEAVVPLKLWAHLGCR